MKTKQILQIASCALLIATQTTHGQARPNVLLMIADDLNIEGVKGLPQARTPNLDRLRQRGVTFVNAHCAAPLCGPSRASLLTGLYPHTTGWYGWGQNPAAAKNFKPWGQRPVIHSCTVLPQHFAKNGYDVFGTGKIGHGMHEDAWMFANADGVERWGFRPVSQGPWASDGLDPKLAAKGRTWLRSESPEYIPAPLREVGRWFAPLSHVPNVLGDPKAGTTGHQGWVDKGEPFRYVSETDRDLMSDEKSTRYALDVIKQKHDRPFLLAVGFCKPHEPLVAPGKYFELFKDKDITLPPYFTNDLADCAKALTRETMGRKVFRAVQESGSWEEYIRAYLACVSFVDDQVGQLLDALDKSPFAENTLVIFCGDNGYHLGEKDIIDKMTVWNESTRVPLLIRAPGAKGAGKTSNTPVNLIDLYPTLIDLCGLPGNPHGRAAPALDGHSMRALLDAPEAGVWSGPPVALTAWMGDPTPAQRADCLVQGEKKGQHFTVCSTRYRYTLANSGEEELYDHEKDPGEWHNRAGDPALASVKGDLKAQLLRLVGER